ncbi:MAG: glycosyltransferase family 2 protein [Nitrospirae bacterium]|nr:glycosyltransferase family 2 protein [Nitrospirota bacterium]
MEPKVNDITKRGPSLSVVIPCYNEEPAIRETNSRVSALVGTYAERGIISDYEIIYVNDGSKDATLKILKELATENDKLRIISFSGNFGHQAALTAGLHHAGGDVAVSLDADLQDPPEVMEAMLAKYAEGADIVFGVRSNREQDTFFKRFTAESFYKLMHVMGVNVVYNHADFRLISRPVLDEFKHYGEINRFLRGIFPSMGFVQASVEYSRDKRIAGETKYPLRKMLAFALEGITSFSNFPLRLAFILGFANFVVALFLVAWTLMTKLKGNAIPGWASIVVPLYLFGGIQLMFIGVLAEYVGKIYMEVKHRPIFTIREKVNFRD